MTFYASHPVHFTIRSIVWMVSYRNPTHGGVLLYSIHVFSHSHSCIQLSQSWYIQWTLNTSICFLQRTQIRRSIPRPKIWCVLSENRVFWLFSFPYVFNIELYSTAMSRESTVLHISSHNVYTWFRSSFLFLLRITLFGFLKNTDDILWIVSFLVQWIVYVDIELKMRGVVWCVQVCLYLW